MRSIPPHRRFATLIAATGCDIEVGRYLPPSAPGVGIHSAPVGRHSSRLTSKMSKTSPYSFRRLRTICRRSSEWGCRDEPNAARAGQQKSPRADEMSVRRPFRIRELYQGRRSTGCLRVVRPRLADSVAKDKEKSWRRALGLGEDIRLEAFT